MKAKKFTSLILAAILLLTSPIAASPAAFAATKKPQAYISITESQITSSQSFKVRNVYFDAGAKKAKTTCAYRPTAQYQLSLYDKKDKKTYYVRDYRGNNNIKDIIQPYYTAQDTLYLR